MANIGNILSINSPSGFWVNIIKAFEGVTGHYVLAIIFLTVVIRLAWAFVETFSKYAQQKQTAIQTQMQPELEKLKAKYQSQPAVLSQKQNELYRKYYGRGYYGSCIIMLVIMVLNMVIFFTLFSGLNTMARYKTAYNYDKLKYQYANCLNVADTYLDDYSSDKVALFADYENIEFKVSEDGTKIGIYKNGSLIGEEIDYKTDFSTTEFQIDPETEEEIEVVTATSNENILELINRIFPSEEADEIEIAEGLYLSTAIQNISMSNIYDFYEQNKDSFLWIENIWQADSPLVKSTPSYKSIASSLGKKNVGEGEEQIYNAFMKDLAKKKNRANGYFILPILCVLSTMLSIFITTTYNKMKNKKKGIVDPKLGFKWTQIIIPLVLGLFALLYNSVFAIYMVTGQLVSALVTPLQLLVIDKYMDSKKKKEEEKVVVEYSRKF